MKTAPQSEHSIADASPIFSSLRPILVETAPETQKDSAVAHPRPWHTCVCLARGHTVKVTFAERRAHELGARS